MFYSKEQLFYCYMRKERSKPRLSLLGSIGRIPELFDKKIKQRTVEFRFFTVLDPTEYWGMIREREYLF